MVRAQLQGRDVTSKHVLEAMRKVPRHKFIPPDQIPYAYEDRPLSIGMGQTISQPYIVGLMTQCLDPQPGDKILEIGCGSGYQAAVLAELVREVHSVEIVQPLAQAASERLQAMGYANIHVHAGDGYRGWPEEAPYDGIIVTAAPDHVPQLLKDQLAAGARLVIPVGEYYQRLQIITRTHAGFVEESILDVRFVPMIGDADSLSR
jgi:protein-L-isoaspartate(D-aspartate) O-methyltransferase